MSNKQYVASLSYGKDSMAMLHVIKDVLDLPIDRIITADVWATDTIPADLPPMVEFKAYADKEIKRRWGIEVEHVYAEYHGKKATYEAVFYTEIQNKNGKWAEKRRMNKGKRNHKDSNMPYIYGFPCVLGAWCNSKLKVGALKKAKAKNEDISYIGIASDEYMRLSKRDYGDKTVLPLVQSKWTEQMCFDWCQDNELLSPIYTNSMRGGCWFCHNQHLTQLRIVRDQYPELWELLMKWDDDSPLTFHADGRTVHDFEKRFRWEDEGYKPTEKSFRWADIENPQMNIEQYLNSLEEK